MKPIDKLRQENERKLEEMRNHESVLLMLGEVPEAPTVSNLKDTPTHGWISFRRVYDDPLAIARMLEKAGWEILPATRVVYGIFRSQMERGTVEEIPGEKYGSTLAESTPVAPIWVEVNRHTPAEVACYMRSPDGRIFKLHFAIDRVVGRSVSVGADVEEFRGGWRFKPGTSEVRIPNSWNAVFHDGERVASIDLASVWMPTPQNLDGRVTFQLDAHGQGDCPLALSDWLVALAID